MAQVLRPLQERFPSSKHPEVIAGLESPDDGAAYRLDDGRVLLFTTDFFTPVVDDPYDYGAIAAANALSDVYAMGGEALMALNVAALPTDLPDDMVAALFAGGADKVAEAGAVIVGGHTINDDEPKYGLAVVGQAEGDIFTKGGAQNGDAIVLTKPLGIGVITTAVKRESAEAHHVAAAVAGMKRLNRSAASVLRKHSARCVSDVTGYALVGHATEMASQSGVQMRFEFARLPFYDGAVECAEAGMFPGGAHRNREAYSDGVVVECELSPEQELLLYSPETSGGLLACVAPDRLDALLADLASAGNDAAHIGWVTDGAGISVV